jgi:hypothetical protein
LVAVSFRNAKSAGHDSVNRERRTPVTNPVYKAGSVYETQPQTTWETTMDNLNRYVGCIVRLNKQAFLALKERALRQGIAIDNCFIVATVSRKLRKLVCYGANFRIMVGVSDVVLV